MCDKTGENNNVDWICAKTMINTESIRRIRDVCNDFEIKDIASLLERLILKQENLMGEMFKHTSQIFEYELANKPDILEHYKTTIAHEKGCCADCSSHA